jgi:hypothetical protein
MARAPVPLLLGLAICLAGCSTYEVGSKSESDPNGSYSGSTLNSPVTDENPHVGGDPSYPSSVSDQGKPLATPDKLDGR